MDTDVVDYNEAFKIENVLEFKEENKCFNCAKLLNVKPIYCLQINNDNESNTVSVCGRCWHITKNHEGNKWRQIVYENSAKFMTFPCSFNEEGCDLILTWDKIFNHEMGCSNATAICPANIIKKDNKFEFVCHWKGNISEVEKHIEIMHKDSILDPPYFEEFPKSDQVYFTHVQTKLAIIVMLKQSDTKYYCLVLLNASDVESQYYQYQIELKDESKQKSVILRKNRLEPYGNLLANLVDEEKLLEINLEAIQPMINTRTNTESQITARFGVAMKNKKEIRQIAEGNGVEFKYPSKQSTPKEVLYDENILSELECPVCNEFMVPPIYICYNGHSLCNECLEKVQSCPNCRRSLEHKTRNFTLEKLTTKVHYPCKNRDIGCSITVSSDKLRAHEKVCELADVNCILKCGLKTTRLALQKHLNDVHAEHILKLNYIYSRNIHDKKENNYAVYGFGNIFRLTIKGGINSHYKFNLQQMAVDEPHYRYKLEIIDTSDLELNTTVVSVVNPLSDFPSKTNAVTIPWDLIKPGIVENKHFCFRINMYLIKKRK